MSTPRSTVAERTLYTLAAPVLAVAPHLPDALAPGTTAHTVAVLANWAVAGVGIGAPAYVASKSTEGTGRKLMRLSPLAAAAAVEIAARYTPAAIPAWSWDTVLAAAWATVGWFLLPLSTTGRRRFRPSWSFRNRPLAVQPAEQPAAEVVPVDDGRGDFERGVRFLWERAGNPGHTTVVPGGIVPFPGTTHDFTMMLCSTEPGRPITGLTTAAVAAAFGISENDVQVLPVAPQPGRQSGPGWMEVKVFPDQAERRRTRPRTDSEWWAEKVAATNAIPDSEFVQKIRYEERGVTYWVARMPDGVHERINVPVLCRALEVPFDDGRVFVVVAGADILVSQWDVSPLSVTYPATRELLTPDSEGRWVVGFLTSGQPARNRVYTDRGAAHGLIVAPTGGGKTQLIALFVAADCNFGAVVWVAAAVADAKLTRLGAHIDRQGNGAVYMIRAMRAALALMPIRAAMPWADGQLHDWDPKRPGCPYRPLSMYWDEFLVAAAELEFGAEVSHLAEMISVKGRKYGIGEKIAGQSCFVQDGFSQLLNESLRELCIPVVLKVAPKKVLDMFKSLGVAPENCPDPLPRSFSPEEAGRIERIMAGQPEPPSDANTGGVGWIMESAKPEVLRTLYMDFDQDISHLFPDEVFHLTDHEIAELEAQGLWFDWNEPIRPGEFGPEPDEDDDEDLVDGPAKRSKPRGGGKPKQRGDSVTTSRQALEAIKKLTGV